MATTAERLRIALDIRNMKQADLVAKTGIGKSSISTYLSGDYLPKQRNIYKMALALDVSESWLMGLDVPMERMTQPVLPDQNLQLLSSKVRTAVRIPVLGSVPAGTPIEAIEDIVDWEEIPEDLTHGGKEYFSLQVDGDSMYPEYLSGDVVIVRRQDFCDSGDDCVVYVNGFDATLKTVKLNPDGGITLQPINPGYAPRTYSAEDVRTIPVQIAGVVVEIRRKKRRRP